MAYLKLAQVVHSIQKMNCPLCCEMKLLVLGAIFVCIYFPSVCPLLQHWQKPTYSTAILNYPHSHPAINPVLCWLRNLTPDLFPLQDINSVYLASKPLLTSCLSFVSESSSHYWALDGKICELCLSEDLTRPLFSHDAQHQALAAQVPSLMVRIEEMNREGVERCSALQATPSLEPGLTWRLLWPHVFSKSQGWILISEERPVREPALAETFRGKSTVCGKTVQNMISFLMKPHTLLTTHLNAWSWKKPQTWMKSFLLNCFRHSLVNVFWITLLICCLGKSLFLEPCTQSPSFRPMRLRK